MTSNSKYIVVDTNMLVYATNKSSSHYKSSNKFLRENFASIVLCNQVVNEYLRVLTHKSFQKPLKMSLAIKNVEAYKKSFGSFILPNNNTHSVFIDLINKYELTSNKVFDAYLVATAISNNVNRLVTFNTKDFEIFDEIEVVDLD